VRWSNSLIVPSAYKMAVKEAVEVMEMGGRMCVLGRMHRAVRGAVDAWDEWGSEYSVRVVRAEMARRCDAIGGTVKCDGMVRSVCGHKTHKKSKIIVVFFVLVGMFIQLLRLYCVEMCCGNILSPPAVITPAE